MTKAKNYKYPLRVGRKQKRAILDADGIEVCIFSTGNEVIAQQFCNYMNLRNSIRKLVGNVRE